MEALQRSARLSIGSRHFRQVPELRSIRISRATGHWLVKNDALSQAAGIALVREGTLVEEVFQWPN